MDDKDLFGNSSDQFGFSGGSSLPDPAAAPSTYDSDFLNGSSTTLGGLDNIPDYKKLGIAGFGIGSNIIDKKLIEAGDYDGITAIAEKYVGLIKE